MKTKLTLGMVMLVAVLALVMNGRIHSQDGVDSALGEFDAQFDGDFDTLAGFSFEGSLVEQYIELSSQLANRMSEEELQAAITEMTRELDSRNADDKIKSVRESLQEIIDSHPDTPAAEAARTALQGLERRVESRETYGDGDSNDDANPFFLDSNNSGSDFGPASNR